MGKYEKLTGFGVECDGATSNGCPNKAITLYNQNRKGKDFFLCAKCAELYAENNFRVLPDWITMRLGV